MAISLIKSVRLKYFGQLAEEHGQNSIAVPSNVLTSNPTPQIIKLNGIDGLCVAYPFNKKYGLICYINDGDANSIAKHKLLKRHAV